MQSLEDIKAKIKDALPGLDCVIGWERGWSPLHGTPLFMRSPEDVDRLTWGPFNVGNPATYLTGFKGKKVGVVVKGCDSRSVVQLLQEKLVKREDVVVFGMPCEGVVDLTKVARKVGDIALVNAAVRAGGTLSVTTPEGMVEIPWEEVAADKCLSCQYPNALVSDHFAGEPLPPAMGRDPAAEQLAALEAMAPAELFAHWAKVMERCIRCYACRNACPMCVCRDHCIAQTRDPHWLTQEDSTREKLMFQMIHALHLAGRCTECGECQRSCPVDIPILALRRKLNAVVKDLFDYQAGVDPQAVPPLFTFQVEEAKINERGW
ncbi:4Fe-4S dicluster domain-containing protein [Fundidesulfovibrio terrae]|uniref:4Fe-4S dicluster domain-containing protein n=1 Tax=Fundidesulfovibrio terrae TaxID=2922866 RepID=UPI001FAF060E